MTQSGVDAGGLFRDWLARLGAILLNPADPCAVVIRAATMDGAGTAVCCASQWRRRRARGTGTGTDGGARCGAAAAVCWLDAGHCAAQEHPARRHAHPRHVQGAARSHVLHRCRAITHAGVPPDFADLRELTPEMHDALEGLGGGGGAAADARRMLAGAGGVADLELDFTVPSAATMARMHSARTTAGDATTPMCRGGDGISVTPGTNPAPRHASNTDRQPAHVRRAAGVQATGRADAARGAPGRLPCRLRAGDGCHRC